MDVHLVLRRVPCSALNSLKFFIFKQGALHFPFALDPVNYVSMSWEGETPRPYQCISDQAWSKAQGFPLSIPMVLLHHMVSSWFPREV